MNKQKTRLFFLLAAALILFSCGPFTPAPVTLPPEMIGTAVVETSAVLATQTAEHMPTATITPRPSKTPRPTETPRPTYTPSLTPTPTVTFVLVIPTYGKPIPPPHWEPGTYNNPATDKCIILTQSPFMNTHLPPRTDFDSSWTIRNYSDDMWYGDSVDIVFLGGEKMHKAGNFYDLGVTVKPGESVTVNIDMLAPANPGTYKTLWGLQVGNSTLPVFCHLGLTIRVP
jgi:hypothetical protein